MRLEKRKEEVLRDLIGEFLRTGAAVGSKALAERSRRAVSPATIRSALAELTREGLLEQAHASAGRVPTEKALRLYVDDLVGAPALSSAERDALAQSFSGATAEPGPPLLGAARLLSDLASQPGLFLTESLETTRLERIEFVRVASHRVLVLIVTAHGLVYERLLAVEEDFSAADLQRFAGFLNGHLDGCFLSELRARLEAERARVGRAARVLVERALSLAERAWDVLPAEGELFIEGQAQIAANEEFSRNARLLGQFLEMLDDRRRVAALLARVARGEGVQVLFGRDLGFGDFPLTVIAAPCRITGSGSVGTLGVIGPLRMDYSRVIPLVSGLAGLVALRLGQPGGAAVSGARG